MTITLIRAIIIYVTVIAAVRIMGKRQLGELSNHEFVITILISAVATIPLEDNSIPLTNSLLPVLIFISLEIAESALSMKSHRFSQLFEGKPVVIIKDGRIQQKDMKRLRLTVSDITDNLRKQSIFDINEVKTAVVEANGKLSVLKKDDSEELQIPIIIDGKIINKYFGNIDIPKEEIKIIIKQAKSNPKELLLLTVDEKGSLNAINKG